MLQPFPVPFEDERSVSFHAEEMDFSLNNEQVVIRWLQKVIEQEGCTLRLLNFIFCTDDYLHQLNVEYLDHDTLTDVITFPYTDPPLVEGDIFISIERVRDNAREFSVPFEQELRRVMVHGVLHLCGFGDKTEEEQLQMRKKEDEALAMFKTTG